MPTLCTHIYEIETTHCTKINCENISEEKRYMWLLSGHILSQLYSRWGRLKGYQASRVNCATVKRMQVTPKQPKSLQQCYSAFWTNAVTLGTSFCFTLLIQKGQRATAFSDDMDIIKTAQRLFPHVKLGHNNGCLQYLPCLVPCSHLWKRSQHSLFPTNRPTLETVHFLGFAFF